MERNKIDVLLEIVEVGNLTKTAEKLGYTQSGLTHMMNSLEKEIGFRLLERGRFGIRLTAEGQRLLPLLIERAKVDAKILNEIGLIKDQKQETLRIGAYASISRHWLPAIVDRFQQLYPEVELEIKVGGMEDNYSWLHDGEIDLCLVSSNARYDCEFFFLKDDQLMAVLPDNYPLKNRECFPIEKMNEAVFIMPSFGGDIDVQVVLDRYHVRPFIKSAFVDDSAVLSMVSCGLGISILSELVLRGYTERVLTVPITPSAYRRLGIAMRSFGESTRTAKRFLKVAKEAIL